MPAPRLDVAVLDGLMASLPPDRFAAQRWFRAKGRAIASLALDDAAPLVADPEDAGFDAVLAVVRVSYVDDGSDDRYLLPLVLDPEAPPPASGELALHDQAAGLTVREPRDGEGVWRRLAVAVAAPTAVPSAHGTFLCDPTPALRELVPSATRALLAFEERRMRVEQTNTSVVLGERLIYKSYRQLEAGVNPDLEVSAFLTTHTDFRSTPALAGSVRYVEEDGTASAAGMLQEFLRTDGDAWSWLLDRLRAGDEVGRDLRRIGELSADLHRALASRPEVVGFDARAATSEERAAWRAAAERQLDGAIASVAGEERARLQAIAPAVRERFGVLEREGRPAVSRIHGDYHLGQLLHGVDGAFYVIDFEGEPARPLAERRGLASPLRDVAGMLRSLDYAARTAAARDAGFDAGRWLTGARAAFLAGYGELGDAEPLLDAFELEKACYEVRYEANNRPDWIWLPLAALQRLTGAAAEG